jgi:uracil-DNA glycosylase family protein
VNAEAYLPAHPDLASLRRASADCRGCELFRAATQTVFGQGPADASVVVVGEQPGDREDTEGAPFVGPAGQLLDEALEAAGLDRSTLYVTNAVKHFKWKAAGKRRLHQKPTAAESSACRPWLLAELAAIRPELVVCLGATAAQSMLGASFRVTRQRGEVVSGPDGTPTMATVHPSAILRITDGGDRAKARERFVADLRVATEWLSRR